MAFKCKSVNISYVHANCLGYPGRVVYFLTFGILGVVVVSLCLGCGDSAVTRFPYLVTVMTLYWFRRRQHKNSLWSSSGMNFLSLLFFS